MWLAQLPELMERMRARFKGPVIWIDAAHYEWGFKAFHVGRPPLRSSSGDGGIVCVLCCAYELVYAALA